MELFLLAVAIYILGLMQGFWGWKIYDRIRRIYLLFKDRLETPSGVVKPIVTHGAAPTRHEPIDLTAREDDPGIALRPTPDQVMLQNMKAEKRKNR